MRDWESGCSDSLYHQLHGGFGRPTPLTGLRTSSRIEGRISALVKDVASRERRALHPVGPAMVMGSPRSPDGRWQGATT